MLRLVKQFLHCTSGASLVEVTLVMPLAVMLMAGSAEFGRALYAYHTADKSVKSAARYLARLPATAVGEAWALSKARNLAMTGKLEDGGSPLIRGWTDPSKVRLDAASLASNPSVIHLEAEVPFSTPMLTALGFSNTVTFTVRHEERYISE